MKKDYISGKHPQKSELFYDYIIEMGEKIQEAMSPNVDYAPSIDLTFLPEIVVMAFSNKKRKEWQKDNNVNNKDMIDAMHFLVRNKRVLPSFLAEAGMQSLMSYIKKNKSVIFHRIYMIYREYYKLYIG